MVQNKLIEIEQLFVLLKEHGMADTVPVIVSLGDPIKFRGFDPEPAAYPGNSPLQYPFEWNNVKCSLAIKKQNGVCNLWIRVHDMRPLVGESIMSEISKELSKYWINPVPQRSFIVYTTNVQNGAYTWVQHSTRLYRDMENIYLDPVLKDRMINQLNKFLISSDLYDRYGITWKRIHLFHGPPGSGKTSTVVALTSYFGRAIAKLTLTPDLNSQQVERLFQTVPQNSFVLIEDVDALFVERRSLTSIDFSTLLNCLDGITTVRGLVLFMTTNHVTKLDEAFVRPGRVDLKIEFSKPSRKELLEALKVLGRGYEQEHERFLQQHMGITIAELQKHLFECIMTEKQSIL